MSEADVLSDAMHYLANASQRDLNSQIAIEMARNRVVEAAKAWYEREVTWATAEAVALNSAVAELERLKAAAKP